MKRMSEDTTLIMARKIPIHGKKLADQKRGG